MRATGESVAISLFSILYDIATQPLQREGFSCASLFLGIGFHKTFDKFSKKHPQSKNIPHLPLGGGSGG